MAVLRRPIPDCNLHPTRTTRSRRRRDRHRPGLRLHLGPEVVIRDGTLFDPVNHARRTVTAGTTTLEIADRRPRHVRRRLHVRSDRRPSVTRGAGTGASGDGHDRLRRGHRDSTTRGRRVRLPHRPGIRKFVDTLPGWPATEPARTTSASTSRSAEPDTTTFRGIAADYYVIGRGAAPRRQIHSDLPPTLVRGYVQLSTAASQASSHPWPVPTLL